jgi:phosphoribosylaminoimidazolecarboxamide formyltransferase / IMP cyclohydrolase
MMKKRALMSVSDKTGLVEFASALISLGYEIISTGGTFKVLTQSGIPVQNVSDVTGFPEILDGRVKTLHPVLYAGILAKKEDPNHQKTLLDQNILPIDLLVVNLYPFKETISKESVSLEEAIENIDIGGPTLLRAGAKNYKDVTVLVAPQDYPSVLEQIGKTGEVSLENRLRLALKVFSHTAHYDAVIENYLAGLTQEEGFSSHLNLTFEKVTDLRYGENPQQKAAFYKEVRAARGNLVSAKQLHGKDLSYNNINDADAAIELLKEFEETCVVAIKHANPCGVGIAKDLSQAFKKAYLADPVSIFGGIVAVNAILDEDVAAELASVFLEVVIAPGFTKGALEILSSKKNLRLLEWDRTKESKTNKELDFKRVSGGILVQNYNQELLDFNTLQYVTDRKPDPQQFSDLLFGMRVVKHVKSNAIVLAKDGMTVGIGGGQTNRIAALKIAARYAKEQARGAVLASDAFFPFSDCVEYAHEIGVSAIIQPGGSVRDEESIRSCNERGISMVFTGKRHFKH